MILTLQTSQREWQNLSMSGCDDCSDKLRDDPAPADTSLAANSRTNASQYREIGSSLFREENSDTSLFF